MGILDWLLGRSGIDPAEEKRAGEALERIVQLTNPRLRFARRLPQRLIPAVQAGAEYARTLLTSVPPEREASAAAWQSDPYMRAFFATADDLARAFSRSNELRAWFDANPAAQTVSVVLSMLLVERRVLGVALEGTELRRDVPQTTVSFTDYRARICGTSEAALREDVERRIVDQLALMGMAIATQDQARREVLEQERALLRARLRLLESQGAGLTALAGKPAPDASQYDRLHAELAINEQSLKVLATGPEALDYQLERMREVLSNAAQHFSVSARRLRLNRMNVVVAESDPQPAETLDLKIAHVPIPDGQPETRTFMLVRFPRNALLPRGSFLSEAARMLG